MPDEFDPHHKWLGIPPTERPANHYRLLGIPKFEENADVISNAADGRMAYIRTFQSGPRGTYSQQILNELAVARTTLLNADRKAAYDQELRASDAGQSQGMAVIPVAAEVSGPQQQQAALELQRQLEAVRVREAQLAQQQAQYTAALAQAEALRQAQAQREAFVQQQQRATQASGAATSPVQARPFQPLATAPAILPSKARKKSLSDSLPLPIVVGAIAIPAMLLLLVVGYALSRGSNPPVVEVPTPVETPAPPDEGNTTPITPPPVTPTTNTASKPVDLLALVETPRDIRGQQTTTKEGDKLKLKCFAGYTCALVPYDLPDSYQIDLKVTPRAREGLIIGLNIGGQPCMLNVDGFGVEGGTRSALEMIDKRRPHDPGYTGKAYMGKLLKEGVESSLTLKVVGNSFEFLCDGQTRVTWSGDPSRLGIYGMFDQRAPRKLFVGCWSSEYDINSLQLKPIGQTSSTPSTSSGQSVDLLALIDPSRDKRTGNAGRDGKKLWIHHPQGFACLGVRYKLPDNYQIDYRVTPRNASDSLLLGISVHGRPCMIGIDGYRDANGRPKTSLEVIDGKRPFDAEFLGPAFEGRVLQNDVESLISVRVVRGWVQLLCNGKQIFAFEGEPDRFSIHSMFGQHDRHSMFLGSWASRYEFSSITLQPLEPDTEPLVAAKAFEEIKPGNEPPTVAATPVDLLKQIDLKRDIDSGTVTFNGKVLSFHQPQAFARVRIPYKPPKNYQLDLRITPVDAPDALFIGLEVGGRPCMFGVDFWRLGKPAGSCRSALEMVDGRKLGDSAFTGPQTAQRILHDGQESLISIRIVGGSITFSCDGKEIMSWEGDPQRLSATPQWGPSNGYSLFLGSWSSRYEVSSMTLQPLAESSPAVPLAATDNTAPWRWARHPGDCKGFTLTPDRKRAVGYHVARAPWSIHGMDVSTGDYDQRLDGQGTIENQYTFAAGPRGSLVAFSQNDGNNSAMLVKSMSSGLMFDRVYGKKALDARYVFSTDGKLLASSQGRDSAIIQLHNTDTGNPNGRIASPGELTNAFVERMFAENDHLLVVYSGQKTGTPADLVVAFDWQTLQPKRNWQITPRLDIRGMTFENDLLWVWGAQQDRGPVVVNFRAGAGADAKPDYLLQGASSHGTMVSDIHIPSRTAAILDTTGPRLSVRNWGNNWKLGVVEYRVPVRDARFVEDGKALIVQPTTDQDPTIVWETEPLLDAKKAAAPTLGQLGLANNPQLANGVKAVQRKDLKSSSAGSALPSRVPSPALRQSSRFWRWARHPAKATGMVLSPDGQTALLTASGAEDEPLRLVDLQTGRQVATRKGTALDQASSAIDKGPSYFFAATDLSEKKRRLMLTPFAEASSESSHFKPVSGSEIHFAFSGAGAFAHTEGKANAAITLRNCSTFKPLATIDPPKGLPFAVVEQMLTEGKELGVLYTATRAKKSLACYYNWSDGQPTKRFELPSGDWVGMRRAGTTLSIWGRDDAQRLSVQMLEGPGWKAQYAEKLPASARIVDWDYQRLLLLLMDSKSNRLLLKKGTPQLREWELEYTGPLSDARFTGDTSAVLVLPQSATDPIVCWKLDGVLNSNSPLKAPKLEELETSADSEEAASSLKPGSSSTPPSASSVPPASGERPSRELAKAEISKLGVPMPGGTVNFLNISSDRFNDEHARLLTAFEELDGLHLQNAKPTAKMIEYLGQLPNLKNLSLVGITVTDEQLAGLAKAAKLERLLLQGTGVKGEGLNYLAQVPLKSLNVIPEPNAAGWEAIGQIKTLIDIGSPGGEFGDEQCAAIAKLPNLIYLRLFNARKITGEGMKHIGSMANVQQIDLPQGLKDDDLAPLKNFLNMHYVSLPDSVGDGCIQHLPANVSFVKLGAGIGDAGLADLVKRCPRLQNLELIRCTKLTGQGFAALKDSQVNQLALPEDTSVAVCEQVAQMKSLHRLLKQVNPFAAAKPLSGAHLKPFRGHPALEHVELPGPDDDAVTELSQIPNLKYLHISQTTCKAKGLVQLAKAEKLEQIVITTLSGKKTDFGETEAKALQSLTQLKNLRIFGVTFTPEQVQQIKAAMPKTQVEIQP